MPNVLITGANRGLGLEFARQYLAASWQVYAACRDPTIASELRQRAEDSGGRLLILAMDVTDGGASRRRQQNSTGKLSTSYSTTLALSDRAARRSETSITTPGRRCSKSTLWDLCGCPRRLSSTWHAASANLSLLSPAAWDLLPTIPLAARLFIAARRPQ